MNAARENGEAGLRNLVDERLRKAVEEIVAEAGAFALSRQAGLTVDAVSSKGRLDFVTEVDRQVEEMIAARVAERFPGDGMISEEGTRIAGRSGRTWIVDPIDGTHNYLRGGTSWAVSVAVVSGDGALAAAINAPAERVLVSAGTGRGVWRNAVPFHPSPAAEATIAFTGVSNWMSTDHDRWLSGFVRDELGLADRRTGSAATSLLAVVQGQADLYIGFGEHAWDVAGGAALAEAAGIAHSLEWQASPMEPFAFVCGTGALVVRALAALSHAGMG